MAKVPLYERLLREVFDKILGDKAKYPDACFGVATVDEEVTYTICITEDGFITPGMTTYHPREFSIKIGPMGMICTTRYQTEEPKVWPVFTFEYLPPFTSNDRPKIDEKKFKAMITGHIEALIARSPVSTTPIL